MAAKFSQAKRYLRRLRKVVLLERDWKKQLER
jgi:hypothetical protein